MSKQKDFFGFTNAINADGPVVEYRIFAELSAEDIGITAWYTKAVFNDIANDVMKAGYKIVRVESRFAGGSAVVFDAERDKISYNKMAGLN